MILRARFALAAAILTTIAVGSQSPAHAQEKDKDKDKKAKDAAVENLKKIKIDKPTVVETDNFIIAGSIPGEKAKALGVVLEKTLTLTRKAAKFDEKEFAWKGKLTVYYFPDGDEFKTFMRRVLQADPKEGAYFDFRAEPALMVDPAELNGKPAKPTDADFYASVAARMAGEHLRAKGTGTQVVPEWLRDGFGRVTVMKATGSPRYAAYKAAARNAVLNSKTGTPPAIADVWSGEKSPSTELLANSLAEFLAYGPKAADFGKFLDGLKPSEGVATPTATNGFMALGWKDDAMADAAWKKWVQTGK
jgi:hypothetical protein